MAILTIIALILLALIAFGWLVPLIIGIVWMRRGSGGTVLTILGGIWAAGVGLVVLLAWLGWRQFSAYSGGSVQMEDFDAAKYQGQTGTMVLAHKGQSVFEAYLRGGNKILRFSTPDGVLKAPVGSYDVRQYQAIAKDSKGREWIAACYPDAKVSVKAGASTKLDLGPPFTASITVKTSGKDRVSMDLKLAGTNGGQYTIRQKGGKDEPPSFVALDKAGQVVWQGRFAYG